MKNILWFAPVAAAFVFTNVYFPLLMGITVMCSIYVIIDAHEKLYRTSRTVIERQRDTIASLHSLKLDPIHTDAEDDR